MGTIRVSVPFCTAAPVVLPKKTVVSAADCEDTIAPCVMSAALFRMTFALSEAKYREPLLAILSCPTPDAAFAVIGEDAEGREVVMVSLRLVSVAAFAWLTKKHPKRMMIKKIITDWANCFTKYMYYLVSNYFREKVKGKNENGLGIKN